MKKNRSRFFWGTVLALVIGAAPDLRAQTTSGRITGTVYDAAHLPMTDVAVTVTNQSTGLSQSTKTDATGAYVLVGLPRGTYTVSAEAASFKKAVRTDNELVADGRLTVDFHLETGALSEAIEIVSAGETINRVSGEISRTVDRQQVETLAFNGRNYLQLATLMPGAPLLEANYNALDIMTGLGINTSVNGSRGNQSSLTVDGEFNMDSGSNNSQISNVGLDFIEEVNVKAANFSAEYGRNAGAAINVVTRSGGNELKGSVYEYHRQESFDANDYFNIVRGAKKAPLTFNDFGWSLGGPIEKNKLFFFVGQEWKQIRRLTSSNQRTLPTRAQRAGDFSALGKDILDPLTGKPFPGMIIPADRITADGKAIANVYAAMEQQARAYDDKVLSNNALFQDDNPFNFRQEMVRVDYQANQAHRVSLRLLHDTYNLDFPYGTFIDSQLPTIPTNRRRPGRNLQLSETWTVSPTLINEFKAGLSGNGQKIPPVGDAWKRETYGYQYPQLFSGGGAYENSIPDTTISGYASFAGAARSLISPTSNFQVSNSLTWLKGAHTMKGGLTFTRNKKDQNGRSVYAGSVNFSSSGNSKSTGNAFADALLGNFRSYQEAQVDPTGYFRFSQLEGFVTDNWRVSDDLSLELGVRYAWYPPIYTLGNNMANFDPALYNPANAVTVNRNGTLVPDSGDRYNGMVRAGDGVPQDQLSNVPTGNSPTVTAVPAGAPRGLYKTSHLLAPRASLAWSPGDGTTSIRAGIGLFYDRAEGNLLFGGAANGPINNPPYNLSSQFENGNIAFPGGGSVPAPAPLGSIAALDPDLAVPRTWNWSISVQRELGRGIFGELGYVGSKGTDLIRQVDINLPSLQALSENAALPAAQRANTNFLRPYKGYSAIYQRVSDGESRYRALQAFLSKRRGDLLWTLSYTWSLARDNGSSNDSGNSGQQTVDFAVDRAGNWGPADYDRTHVGVATVTWRIPAFKEQKGIGRVLGGWELSGIGRIQSGAPFTVTADTAIGNRRADFKGGDPYLEVDADSRKFAWLDKTFFSASPEGRLGTSQRNEFRGPGFTMFDLSVRKGIVVKGDARLQLQADFFNVFNTVAFRNPGTNLANGDFGTISQALPPRNVQIGARLTF